MSSDGSRFDISQDPQLCFSGQENHGLLYTTVASGYFPLEAPLDPFGNYENIYAAYNNVEASSAPTYYHPHTPQQDHSSPLPTTECSPINPFGYTNASSLPLCSTSESPIINYNQNALSRDQPLPSSVFSSLAGVRQGKPTSHDPVSSPQSTYSIPLTNHGIPSCSPEPPLRNPTPTTTTVPSTRTPSPTSRRQGTSYSSVQGQQSVDSAHSQLRFVPIFPKVDPTGLRRPQQGTKRRPSSDPELDSHISKHPRRSPPVSPQSRTELKEDEVLLLLCQSKTPERRTWKEIQEQFHKETGNLLKVPALQMRLKRLQERRRVWTDADIEALKLAYEWYTTKQFEIICSKMSEFGATEKWDAKQCKRKWLELSHYPISIPRTPMYTASPVDAPDSSFCYPPPFHHVELSRG